MIASSPFPTILGYYDHQLPHAYHVIEVALTWVAEFVAPFLAVFAGRRGRWWAFVIWTLFQAGIQATNNFGWLNTASIALGLLLLDDQMLAAAAGKLRLPKLGEWLARKAVLSSIHVKSLVEMAPAGAWGDDFLDGIKTTRAARSPAAQAGTPRS